MGSAKKLVVAIDGPAGSGKSTIARMLAQRLGYRYVDTGAMYRALTWQALKDRVPPHADEALAQLARKLKLRFVEKDGNHLVLVDKEDVTQRIRTERVSKLTSRISAISGVRRALRQRQRQIGRRGGVVMEGRDIGTDVFPRADIKFYLDASPLERARRRYHQLKAKGQPVSLQAIAEAIRHRDYNDKHRGINPLRPAQDAIVLDSTKLSQHDVIQIMLHRIESLKR